jgi:drug/metabolite transporter (DMT)-like permease
MTIGQGTESSASSSSSSFSSSQPSSGFSCVYQRWSDTDTGSNKNNSNSSRSEGTSGGDDDEEGVVELQKKPLEESSTFSITSSSSSSSSSSSPSVNDSNNSPPTPEMLLQRQQQQLQPLLLPSSSVGFFTRLRLRKQAPLSPSQQGLHSRHSSKDIKQQISNHNSNNNNNNNGAATTATPAVNWAFMSVVILAWYLIGVVAICTTKMLLTDFSVPPLVLTVQQLLTGSLLLRMVLVVRDGGARPWPVVHYDDKHHHHHDDIVTAADVETAIDCSNNKPEASSKSTFWSWNSMMQTIRWYIVETTVPIDFILAGLFNALDFLASNTAFSGSSASFVETIKASEPITTTAVALLWKIDQLHLRTEGASLGILVAGVLLTTVGNKEGSEQEGAQVDEKVVASSLLEFNSEELDEKSMLYSSSSSILSFIKMNPATTAALTVMTANLCYAFRALSQKRFRAWEKTQQQEEENDHHDHNHDHSHHQDKGIDDINLLMRMQHVGAMSLIIPAIFSFGGTSSSRGGLWLDVMTASTSSQVHYLTYAVINTLAYATYNLASTYVLTSLSVLQHSSLNCLRRMFCTIATSIFFGVTWSAVEALGVVLCFCGFLSFTHFRGQRSSTTTNATITIATPTPTSSTTTSTSTSSTSLSSAAAATPPPPAVQLPTSVCDNNIQMMISGTATSTATPSTSAVNLHYAQA